MQRKWTKVFLTLASAGVLLIGSDPVFASGSGFTDVSGHWGKQTIEDTASLDLFHGYPDGAFHPDNSITRAEFVTVLDRAMNSPQPVGTAAFSFADVQDGDWYAPYIKEAIESGVIVPGDFRKEFQPNQAITRGEIARMVVRAIQKYVTGSPASVTFSDVKPTDPMSTYIQQAAADNVIKGYPDGTFHAEQPATRAEAATMILRALQAEPQQGPYNNVVGGVQNAAGPLFAISEFLSGVRDLTVFERTTDFTTLSSFADNKVVQKFGNLIQTANTDGSIVDLEWDPLLPEFVSRDYAIVQTQDVSLIRQGSQVKQQGSLGSVTWYLKFENGTWQVIGSSQLNGPKNWVTAPSISGTTAPYVDYKYQTKSGTYFGTLALLGSINDPSVLQNIEQLFSDAGSDKVTIYAIGGVPVEKTPLAAQIQSLEQNPPSVDHSGKVQFLTYEFGIGQVSPVWFPKENVAAGFFAAFTNNNQDQLIQVDGVPWNKIWDNPLWMTMEQKETLQTIYPDAKGYEAQIESLLNQAR